MNSNKVSESIVPPDDALPSHLNAEPPTPAASDPESKPPAEMPAISDAARSWAAMVDGWWRQQSKALPPDLQRAITTTLNQSKAMVDMACGQTTGKPLAPDGSDENAPAEKSLTLGGEAHEGFGLWQPIVDAFQVCQEKVLTAQAHEPPHTASAAMTEYQDASRAYLGEFMQLNAEVMLRIQQTLANAGSSADLRAVHELVLDKAEEVYLERVSSDSFAKRQARFVNALLRLRRDMTVANPGSDTGSGAS